ncbi:MAG TPA: phosphatase, partial [Nitrosospira sp.]
MFKQKKLSILVSGALMVMAGATQTIAADTHFANFTPQPGSVAAGFLPENAPFQLSSPNFSQIRIADRTTQLGLGEANSGNWDMITANETGPDAGRYLFSPFETSTAGVQRTDLMTGLTKTLV